MLTGQAGEEAAEAEFEEPAAVHGRRVFAEAEENKDGEAQGDSDPAVEDDRSSCGYLDDLPPRRPVDIFPAVRVLGEAGVTVQDVELKRKEEDDEG